MSDLWELRTLGGFDLVGFGGGGAAERVALPPKAALLLAYLAVERRGRTHARGVLLALLWPELSEGRARAALSQALYVLRRTLGADVVRSQGKEEVLLDGSRLWCDAAVVEECLRAGRIGMARSLWTGDFLAGAESRAPAAALRWIEEVRERTVAGFAGAAATSPTSVTVPPGVDPEADLDPEADALYRRALARFMGRSVPGLRDALRDFEAMLLRAPARADALAGVAETEILLAMYDPAAEPSSLRRSAVRHAVEAVQAEPRAPQAHRALGRALADLGQRDAALSALGRALELDPLDAEARQWLAGLLLEAGRVDEAREESERAVELAPHSAAMHAGQATVAYLTRRPATAIAAAHRARAFGPGHEGARAIEALALLEAGEPEAALIAAGELVRDLPEGVYGAAVEAWIRSQANTARMDPARADTARAEPSATRLAEPPRRADADVSRGGGVRHVVAVAMAHLARGEADAALDALATIPWNATDRMFVAFAPVFDSLRADPHFAALLEEAGLPPAPCVEE